MKLCTDCADFHDMTSKCKAVRGTQEPIRGFDVTIPVSAWVARSTELYCGAEAKWFKPKTREK